MQIFNLLFTAFTIAFCLWPAVASCNPVQPTETAGTTDAASQQRQSIVQAMVDKYGDRLVKSRYMEKNCEPVTWPGWEGFPTQKCRYSVTDKASGITKYAEVVMLNAPPEKIANWVATACLESKTSQPLADCDGLVRHILNQSGGQFPVAGVVYEDMEGDGYYKAYCFRDGVTVQVAGIAHRTTATLSASEIQASLTGEVTKVYTYARVAGTTPDMYKAGGGNVDVGSNADRNLKWPQVIGDLYRKAWSSDTNELISLRQKAGF